MTAKEFTDFIFFKRQQKRANNHVRPLMIFIEIRFAISLQIVLFLLNHQQKLSA